MIPTALFDVEIDVENLYPKKIYVIKVEMRRYCRR